MADPENPQGDGGPDNSGQEKKRVCRRCGAKKRPNVKWIAPDYCSGICMRADGLAVPVGKPSKDESPKVEDKPADRKATLKDYQAHPEDYHRRLDPEKLNWGEPLSAPQLKQAGLRANRKPIPGDWDYVEEQKEEVENV